jgi:hypothetical protein
VPVSFRRGADGELVAITVGLEPELAPLAFERV